MNELFKSDYPLNEKLATDKMLLDLFRMLESKKKTTRQQEREAKKRLKQNPDDNDAIADIMELEAKRRTVIFDARTRYMIIDEHSLKGNSNRTQTEGDYALGLLVEIWKDGTGREIVKTTDFIDGQPGDEFFRWAAIELEKWGIKQTPIALLHRFRKPSFLTSQPL